MDSTQFGESLLASVRDRNDALAKQARKRAKSDAWKKLGVKVLIGAGEELLKTRQNQFLNDEEQLSKSLQIKQATDTSTRITEAEKAAESFGGGRELYFQQLSMPEVDAYLKETYKDGTYSQATYDLYKAQLAKQWGAQKMAEHDEHLKTVNSFLSKTGGNPDAFNDTIRHTKATTISGGIANIIGGITGIMDNDVANLTGEMLESAEQVNAFQYTLGETKDPTIANFVAQNELLRDVDLGGRAPTIGDLKMRNDGLGGEEAVIPVITYDPTTGNPNMPVLITIDEATGNMGIQTPTGNSIRNNFSQLVSRIGSVPNNPWAEAGSASLQNHLTKEQVEEIVEIDRDSLPDNIDEGGQAGIKVIEQKNNLRSQQAGAIIYSLSREQQIFNSNQSAKIAAEMVRMSVHNPNSRILMGAGIDNPFHTMQAVHNLVDAGKMELPEGMDSLYNTNPVAIYEALRTETKQSRDAIKTHLESKNFYGSQVDADAFSKIFYSADAIISSPQNFLTDDQGNELNTIGDKLEYAFVTQYKGNPAEKPTEEPTEGEKKITITPAMIELYGNSMPLRKGNLKGLSNAAIIAAYGDDIASFYSRKQSNDKFWKGVGNWWSDSLETSKRYSGLTEQEKKVYRKTGKWPEDFEQ